MKVAPVVAVLFAAALASFGQESRGTVMGRVTDVSGAAVAGARVHAVRVDTNAGASTSTNQEGNYEIPFLLPGSYRVTAAHPGFKESVRAGVELGVDERLPVDFTLQLGEVTQSVVVTAESPLIDVSSPSLGKVIDDKQITELPIAGGNPFYLSRLSAGVMADGGHLPGNPTQDFASGSLIVNGTRSGNSEASIDGASNMSGTGASFSPPGDLVQEFKIQTLPFDASLGHAVGAIVNVSIKSGTNKLHGTTYYFDSRLRAAPWFYNHWLYDPTTGPITPEKKSQSENAGWLYQRWGQTLGGPVVIPKLYNGRNRTFWIFGYEGMHVNRTATYTGTVPTPQELSGDFSALLKLGARYQIYDPATIADAGNGQFSRQPLPGNILPGTRISPIAKNIAEYWPKPNSPGTADGQQNFFRIRDQYWDYRSELGRFDHAFSEGHRVYARYNQSHFKQITQNLPTIANGDVQNTDKWGAVLDDVYVLTPAFLVNLRYGITRQTPVTTRLSQGFDMLSLGLPASLVNEIRSKNDAQGIAFPQIQVDGYAQLGANGGSLSATTYQTWAVTFTRVLGNHSLRFGGEYRLLRETGVSFGNVAPNLVFSTTWTKGPMSNSAGSPIGQGLASLLFGLPTGGGMDIDASRAEQSAYTGWYIQDDWKASRRLTLNFGLRYEFETPTTERYNRSIRGLDLTTPSPVEARALANYARAPIPDLPAANFHVRGGLTFPGIDGLPRTLWDPDKNNFAPRVGLAFQVAPKTVIRSGYGIFFAPTGIDRRDVNQGGFNQTTPFVASQNNGLSFVGTLADPFPGGLLQQTGATRGLLTQIGNALTYFNGKQVSPYMQRWSFSVQRELPSRVLFEASYVGNRGTKLNASRQMNPTPRQYFSTSPARDQAAIDYLGAAVPNPFYGLPEFTGSGLAGKTVARSQITRPMPQFQGITTGLPMGFSYYHALQIRAEKRFTRGTSFQVGYTWSKFMEATSFLNATDPVPEKVISDQDHPHRIILGAISELPFGRGKRLLRNSPRWLNAIVAGWQAQGWYEGQSGPALGFGNALFYGNLHDIPLPVGQRSTDEWFNVNAGFERASNKQLGSNVRTFSTRFNGVRADGINNLDCSVFKVFHLSEAFRLQFRAEAFNALNHAQFDAPNTTPTSTAFGTVTSELGHGQRQINFGLKLLF